MEQQSPGRKLEERVQRMEENPDLSVMNAEEKLFTRRQSSVR